MIGKGGNPYSAGNWIELQEKLDWLSKGVIVRSLTIPEYITGVRELMDSYEFMAMPRGS